MAMTTSTFEKLGKPSAIPTSRGDCAEEYTYKAEENNVPFKLYMPKRFDAPPIRMQWETNTEPFWRLADGMPHYGIGTTFADDDGNEVFYHNYQIFQPGQQERFWNKCESILGS